MEMGGQLSEWVAVEWVRRGGMVGALVARPAKEGLELVGVVTVI